MSAGGTGQAPGGAADELLVRPMAEGEEAIVIALWQRCGLTRPWNDPRQDLEFARGKAASDILVGQAGGGIIASAMVGHDGHRGVMYYVSVHPDCRRTGAGSAIVRAAENWLKARGVWKMNLLVRRGNEQVLGFYDALGYTTAERVVLERWLDPARSAKQK